MENNLEIILSDLQVHTKRNRESLMIFYINKRLEKSLYSYYKDLSSSLAYLENKDSCKIAKGL